MRIGALAAALIAFTAGCKLGREPVVAKVGKLPITESEFRRKLSEVAPEYQNYVLTPNGRRQFLDVLIREKMVLAAANDSGIKSAPEFKAQMERLRQEEDERLAEGRDYLVTQLWLEDLRRKGILSVTDDEVKDYHKRNPKEVEVRHILVATPEEAEALIKRIRSGAANFNAMAQKSLDAETAAAGGRMRPAIYGEIIPDLEDVVFRGKVGETLGPVRSKFGYHILRKDSERFLSFDRAEARVRKILEKQKLDRHLQSLQSRYPVEVLDVQIN